MRERARASLLGTIPHNNGGPCRRQVTGSVECVLSIKRECVLSCIMCVLYRGECVLSVECVPFRLCRMCFLYRGERVLSCAGDMLVMTRREQCSRSLLGVYQVSFAL